MHEESNDVKQRLIEIGRKEFLDNGYVKASMRNISNAAGVTTGAVYFFFRNKEDFFKAILQDTANEWKQLMQNSADSEIRGSKSSVENDSEMIRFLFNHKEEVRILFERAEGTIYHNYREELCEIILGAFLTFFTRMGGKAEDVDIVRIIVRMRLQGYSEMLHGDYTMEQAIKYAELLASYGDSGFAGMMKQYNMLKESSIE